MSDAADKRTDEPSKSAVSMDKKPSGPAEKPSAPPVKSGRAAKVAAAKTPAPVVPQPRTIQLAAIAIVAQVVFTMAHALFARGYTSQLSALMIKSNNDAKKPENPFNVVKHVADYRKGLLFQGVVLSLAFILLAASLRRSRGAGPARWGFLIITVFVIQTNGPLAILPISDYPGTLQVFRTLLGLSSLAAIVLLFMPASLRYFRECKAANRPEGAPVRPGLGSLFTGRGAAGGGRGSLFAPRPAPAAAKAAKPTKAAEPAAAGPARPKSKAKVRAEADAVAKGAELARTRAKASKSRRVEPS